MKEMRPDVGMWRLYKMGGITPAVTSMFNPRNAQQMAFIRQLLKDQRKHSLLDTSVHNLPLVVFDLETTGFTSSGGDEILSFGAVSMTGAEIEGKSYYSLVNPNRGIPEHIEKLTGITAAEADQAPDLIVVLREFFEFVGTRVLLAHGSAHDKAFLNAALWKTSKTSLTHRVIDSMMVAKWLIPGNREYSLDALLKKYDIPVLRRHHALDDAKMTAVLWQKLLGEIREMDVDTLGDLYNLLSKT
ncbi:exonuclease domain-containing protein [Paenibacillus lutrae]|uniref:3'-5' exonuclease n=1 Tax=Paenibacillus lutrae TaxID=2078573 RepID=A0A7X3FFB2_9BACL|nr:exonuclease domain-containing protein [Paenibacillus lutrae]MVO98532.1 3'-5' exonuclease [Paenibacillus lutrae]